MTSMIGIALLLGVFTFVPKTQLVHLFAVFVAISSYEMILLLKKHLTCPTSRKSSEIFYQKYSLLTVVSSILVFYLLTFLTGTPLYLFLTILFQFSMVVILIMTRNFKFSVLCMGSFFLVIFYAGLPWVTIWYLIKNSQNNFGFLLLLALVWSGDTFAYLYGKHFGRHKLIVSLSPNKTWEGAIAGLFASIVASIAICLLYTQNSSTLSSIALGGVIGLLGGLAAQIGDLVESSFKRSAKVKNSSSLLPGHGGFLDRVDSLLFAAPVVLSILYFWYP